MKKVIFTFIAIVALASCEMFSALDTMADVTVMTAEYYAEAICEIAEE